MGAGAESPDAPGAAGDPRLTRWRVLLRLTAFVLRGKVRSLLYFDGLLGIVTLGLWIFCLVDVITTDESSCRNLPKLLWLLLVLVVPLAGSICWLVAGRPQAATRASARDERQAPAFPEYDRPGRYAATSPEDDEEFLRRCRERAEAQRKLAREKRGED